MLSSTALVWLMTPGVGLLYSGLLRRKNALSMLFLCMGVGGVVTFQVSVFIWEGVFLGGGEGVDDLDSGGFGVFRWRLVIRRVRLLGILVCLSIPLLSIPIPFLSSLPSPPFPPLPSPLIPSLVPFLVPRSPFPVSVLVPRPSTNIPTQNT